MNVFVRNQYTRAVWLAVMYYDPNSCSGHGDWGTAGWWRIDRGATVFPFWTYNRYAAYYAEADDGAVWAGDRGPVYVTPWAFRSCVNIGVAISGTPVDTVGMRLLDLGPWAWVPAAPYTLTLTP